MTPEELRTAQRVPRVKTLRRALGLTQQQFAARYHIPLGTLRDWEQGRTEPDQPARLPHGHSASQRTTPAFLFLEVAGARSRPSG
jgi:transcriptional regulator with XRE-family HTH domain